MWTQIKEILDRGALGRVRHLLTEDVESEQLLCSIWGVGPSTAKALMRQGVRTVEQCRANRQLFTPRQLIALDHFEELQQRIPRAEVAEIASVVW